MAHTENNLPSSTKTAEALGEEYAQHLKEGNPFYTVPILKFISTLDMDALCASACQVMKRECSNIYHIATGGFLSTPSKFCLINSTQEGIMQ